MSKPRKPRSVCPYCCKRPGTTKDHVIADCLFPRPLPNGINFPTVKACSECNNEKKAGDDTYLRDYLVMQMECLQHAGAQSLRLGELARAASRNQSHFLRQLGVNPRPVTVVQQQPEKMSSWLTDQCISAACIELGAKIVRGLYFKQSHHLLPVNFHFLGPNKRRGFSPKYSPVGSGITWSQPPSLSNVFSCLYCPAPVESCRSCWVLGFYDQVCFIVWTFKSMEEAMEPRVHSMDAVIIPPDSYHS